MRKQQGFRRAWSNGGRATVPHVDALQQMQLVPVESAEASDVGAADDMNRENCDDSGVGASSPRYKHAKSIPSERGKLGSTARRTWRDWDEPENVERLQRLLPFFLCLAVLLMAGLVAAGIWFIHTAMDAKGGGVGGRGGD